MFERAYVYFDLYHSAFPFIKALIYLFFILDLPNITETKGANLQGKKSYKKVQN